MRVRVFTLTATTMLASGLAAQITLGHLTHVVQTGQGLVRGQTDGSVDRFMGLPYAVPPVGDLRWKPAAAAPGWHGIREAIRPASECTQAAGDRLGRPRIAGSEDCLYLNVYRPANTHPGPMLPVLIFIHGGSNQRGTGSGYDPSEIVAREGIVAVTINYRLNVFGFLALPSLDAEAGEPSSGNYGLLDQQAAFRWVQANISAFGGDPHRVTIDGESAGGIDVCANLVSPLAAGLFDKAIMESMYCPAATHNEALGTGAPVAAALGCTNASTAAACMRDKTASDLLKAAGPLSIAPGSGAGFNASPNYGNTVLPLEPAVALRSGKWNQSAILIGSNHDESSLFLVLGLVARWVKLPLSDDAYQQVVSARYGSFAPELLQEYPTGRYASPFIAYTELATDGSPLGCAVSPLAQSFAALHRTFRYEFTDPDAPVPPALRLLSRGDSMQAYHGSELQYLFRMDKLPGPQTAAQQQLSAQMIQYWGNFVKTGNPNGAGLVEWPNYDADTHRLLSLQPGGNTVIDNFDLEHHCSFWASAPADRSQQ